MLTPEQLLLLGIIAAVLSQGWKLLASYVDEELAKKIVAGVVLLVSVGLGYYWLSPELPPTGDPLEWVEGLLAQAAAVLGFALVIYRYLLDNIFKAVRRIFLWASGR